MSIDEILLAVFFTVLFLFLASRSAITFETFASEIDPNLQLTITKKDKPVTCTEASLAYTTLIRYVARELTGDGAIILNNLRETFFEVDDECYRTKKCSAISLRGDLNPDTLYKDWSNPLKCQV
jgi:hypothetical protein